MRPLPQDLVDRLFRAARASRWNLTPASFAAALERSAARLGAGHDTTELARRLEALHLEDLALARACEEGAEGAWEHFVREFRPALYRAGNAIAASGGRELADSLYADLFGLRERDGERQSLFRYFHGRSSLATWLRAVLAQRHVDGIRAARRLEPLPDEDAPGSPAAPPAAATARSGCVELVRQALAAAVAKLPPADRLRLGWYYSQEMTLAQIGRVLKEHEATVSRQLNRTRKDLRAAIEGELTAAGLGPAEMADCLSAAMEDPGAIDLAEMVGPAGTRKKAALERSPTEGLP